MDSHQIKMLMAGICFGIYPLLLNRSELKGNVVCAVFSFIVFFTVMPFGYGEFSNVAKTRWPMMIGAGILSGAGLLFMTRVLTDSSQQKVGLLVVFMTIIQISVCALYQVWMDKGLSPSRIAGFVLAAVAIVLLNKK